MRAHVRIGSTREWRNLADAPDLGSGGATHGGSSPPSRTSPPSGLPSVAGTYYLPFCLSKARPTAENNRSTIGRRTMKILPIHIGALVAAVLILSAPLSVCAQTYYYHQYMTPGYYYPFAGGQVHGPRPTSANSRAVRRPVQRRPASPSLYYRMTPRPNQLRKWAVHRKWLERQQWNRSPLNPESTLDYMMRTFW